MTRKLSFSAHERRVLPHFRERMNKAESTEEVNKFFVQAVEQLLDSVLDETVRLLDGDVGLLPHSEPFYRISDRLRSSLPEPYWTDSDLPHVIHRLADSAAGRYKHLEKHPEKTEVKIRM